MKKLLGTLGLFALLAFGACKPGADYSGRTPVIQDSMAKVIPTYQSLRISVSDDWTQLNIIVGDPALYASSAEEKTKKADEVAKLVLRIYGKGNYLSKGNLVVTKNTRNTEDNPADGIATPFDFEGLKKQGF